VIVWRTEQLSSDKAQGGLGASALLRRDEKEVNVRKKLSLQYKGYTISVWIDEAQEPGKVTRELIISRSFGAGWTEYKEPIETLVYDFEDKAVLAGQQRGMQIIDGKVLDVTLKF
jgi:hypothetical protein